MKFGAQSMRFKALSSWLPILVNFLVIGLWHGPKFGRMSLFGLYQGTWFILESQIRWTGRWKAYVNKTSGHFRLRAGQIVMFLLMVISFAIFRSESLTDFGHLMGNLTQGWDSSSISVLFVRRCTILLIVAFAIIWLCPNTYEFLRDQRPGILSVGGSLPRHPNG